VQAPQTLLKARCFLPPTAPISDDLNYQDGLIGDLFEAGIEPITSTAPYMGCELVWRAPTPKIAPF
jgi:hypothetical protein